MAHALEAARWLGGKELRGVKSELDFVRIVHDGLPTAVLESLIEKGELTAQEVERYIIPRRTLAHRKRRHQRLTRGESDKLARVARIFALAEDTFQDRSKAGAWLRRANRALQGAAPVELLESDGGARLVEAVLERIAYGVVS